MPPDNSASSVGTISERQQAMNSELQALGAGILADLVDVGDRADLDENAAFELFQSFINVVLDVCTRRPW